MKFYGLLQLRNISVTQFKNYPARSFSFNERVVGICGKNGIGKTNLLDAIYYLCFTKSYFAKTDTLNVQHGMQGFRIEGEFDKDAKSEKITCILRETGKKEFSVNGQLYDKMADHIGEFPCAMIAPDDVEIITGSSSERRRFTDAILSQVDHTYLLQLMTYNRVLLQRNGLLKSWGEHGRKDLTLLDVLDQQLVQTANYVFEKRKKFLANFIALVQQFYRQISGEPYTITLQYQSQLLQDSLQNLLERYRERDIIMQRTNAGIHKDDILFNLEEKNFKSVASQGQRKSLLFALKLAEFETLQKAKGFAPILLLDDVFEKLDEQRMHNLLQWVCQLNNGQVFLTDTHCERLRQTFTSLQTPQQLVQLI